MTKFTRINISLYTCSVTIACFALSIFFKFANSPASALFRKFVSIFTMRFQYSSFVSVYRSTFFSKIFRIDIAAYSAHFTSSIKSCIFDCILVPIFASCRSAWTAVRKISSQEIFFKRNCLEVFGINASRSSTQMIDNKSWLNRSFESLIRKTMSPNKTVSIPKLAITIKCGCGPKPACVSFINFFPKAILYYIFHKQVITRFPIMYKIRLGLT